MTPTLEAYGLDSLSVTDRLALAHVLWDSVHEALEQEPISPELQAELERRAALADADPLRGKPWDEVRAAAKNRWSQ
jgi:putative addiction module component (TIGR02574 family)